MITRMTVSTNRQAGVTLIELMVVVTMLGILSSLAVVSIKPDPNIEKQASVVAQRIATASRLAVRNGPVPPAALSNGEVSEFSSRELGTTRTRVLIDEINDLVRIRVEIRTFSTPPSSEWTEVRSSYLSGETSVQVGYVPIPTIVSADYTYVATNFPIEILCNPDGRCDTGTVYLQDDSSQDFARVAVVEMQALPMTIKGW